MPKSEDTPLMQQWRDAKSRHPDALIFFRVGDFYEMFMEDAEEGARVLGLTLTSRNNGSAAEVPLAGVPVKARDEYIQQLVRTGRRVAICEQVEDASEAKGIVRREVVETVTPGAVLADSLLAASRNNFLVALSGTPDTPGQFALAAADLSTGELVVTAVGAGDLESELARFEPSELLLPSTWDIEEKELGGLLQKALRSADGASRTYRPEWLFDPDLGDQELRRRFGVHSLDGFGFGRDDRALIAALGALVAYLAEVQPEGVAHLRPPRIERAGEAMALDDMTRRNLELVEPLRPDPAARGRGGGGTLLDVLDRTVTAMGARKLRRWILRPLLDPERIWARQRAVEQLVDDPGLRQKLRQELRDVRDLERLAAKLAAGRVTPRELGGLSASIERLPGVRQALESTSDRMLSELRDGFDLLEDIRALLESALAEDPPATLAEGGVIRSGYDEDLDELRETRDGARDFIASLQTREREETGISSLKVGHNKVFGYYLEVTRPNLHKVREGYQRKQTLANAERFFTPELKEWEAKILGAEDGIARLEARLFTEVRQQVAEHVPRLQDTAARVATLDVLAGLADGAERRGYVRPEVHTGYAMEIRGGRHPVVETMMPREEFIPNDVTLDDDARVMILTGPNMAGKSTVLRQVGLIQLLAQIGAHVPAAAARLPVCDRIFTRVGASDNLVRGQSTFMVEMNETAAILHGASDRSLVLLDEIGRGTATYDGVSIAWAVTEHLHEVLRAKTIFATHYHELTQLADRLPALVNVNVAVREVNDDIVFLRRLEPGGADRSYGVQVGRLAGLPDVVVERAGEILRDLEGARTGQGEGLGAQGRHAPVRQQSRDQLTLFSAPESEVLERLRGLEIDGLTPLRALNLLAELKMEARKESGGREGRPDTDTASEASGTGDANRIGAGNADV